MAEPYPQGAVALVGGGRGGGLLCVLLCVCLLCVLCCCGFAMGMVGLGVQEGDACCLCCCVFYCDQGVVASMVGGAGQEEGWCGAELMMIDA